MAGAERCIHHRSASRHLTTAGDQAGDQQRIRTLRPPHDDARAQFLGSEYDRRIDRLATNTHQWPCCRRGCGPCSAGHLQHRRLREEQREAAAFVTVQHRVRGRHDLTTEHPAARA